MPTLFSSRTRWIVPPAIAAVTAAAVLLPQAASGAVHPTLPTLTAAQVLADLSDSTAPAFSGTVVATSNLGLPSLSSLTSGSKGSSEAGLQEVETLLTGSHTIKIAYGGASRQRIAVILSDLSESDVVHNGTDLWTYSSQDNAVTHTTLPASKAHTEAAPQGVVSTPEAAAQQALSAISPSTTVSIDKTAMVAGRSAYQLVLSPKDPTSLVGSVRIAMDSATHLPLRTQVYSTRDANTPAFQIGFTSLTLKAPSASTFAFSTPPGATVSTPALPQVRKSQHTTSGPGVTTVGTGWGAVLVGKLDSGTTKASSGALDDILTPVAGGQALNTALVSVLLTSDGRFLVGTVTPARLQQLAAQGAGR